MTSMRDRLEAAKAPSWLTKDTKPVKGDILSGIILNIATGTSDFGDYPIITVGFTGHPDDEVTRGGLADFTVKTADGPVKWAGGPLAWHVIGTVAQNEVGRVAPQVGDRIGILYDGSAIAQKGTGAGKSYDIFRVATIPAPRSAVDVTAPPVANTTSVVGAAEGTYAAPDDEEPF